MNAQISVFDIGVEVIIYLLLQYTPVKWDPG